SGVCDVEPERIADISQRLLADGLENTQCQRFEQIVGDANHFAAQVVFADAADERGDTAETRVVDKVDGCGHIQFRLADIDHGSVKRIHLQPPLTGGNTASSTFPGTRDVSCNTASVVANAERCTNPTRLPPAHVSRWLISNRRKVPISHCDG